VGRSPFPNKEAVSRLFFLAIRNAKLKWKADKTWYRVLTQLEVFFEGRLPARSMTKRAPPLILSRGAPNSRYVAFPAFTALWIRVMTALRSS